MTDPEHFRSAVRAPWAPPPGADHARSDEACLVLDRVSRSFGGLQAVKRVNLRVRAGERRAIIGPNGAGKTTLFNLISGELPLSGGRLWLFGTDISRLSPHRRAARGLARTFQITNLFPRLSVLENIILAAQALERTKFAMLRPIGAYRHLYGRARRVLEAFGMWDRRDEEIRNLSHGEQRQVEVALALTGEPRVLLLDEPTAGLAPGESRAMAALLRRLDPAITMLIIEHDMDIAFDLAERITVLHLGEIVAEGTTEEIRASRTVQEIYLGAA